MSFHRYDRDSEVHIIDCSGQLSLETGMTRLQVLKRELAEHPPVDGVAKLLIDFRNTVWEDENVHMQLSRITRAEFGLKPGNSSIRAAFVHTGGSGGVSDNERWFASEAAAMDWLCSRAAEDPASAAETRSPVTRAP
ncbi:MAG TPA: hypothetical protein VJV79_32320 [Polyangiaceae bacterium]|nr:hypothetical protein [Polyangiaceae bacterium]